VLFIFKLSKKKIEKGWRGLLQNLSSLFPNTKESFTFEKDFETLKRKFNLCRIKNLGLLRRQKMDRYNLKKAYLKLLHMY
jgi:hypothetical protein